MNITLLQLPVSPHKEQNLHRAAAAVSQAKDRGAELVILPEMFCCPYENTCFPAYAEEAGGMIWRALSDMARENHVWLVGGSFPEREAGRIYNTCFVFSPDGTQTARHRKIHLFDIDIQGGQSFRESDVLSPGEEVTVFSTPFGTFGVCICFDLRFPALFEAIADRGAQAVFVPAAFNRTTGPRHWELLFRSRAVDNQLYTVGVSSARDTSASYVSYGHSIVCNPWGDVLAQMGSEAGALDVQLDLAAVEQVRRQLPVRSARKPFQSGATEDL